MHVVATAVAQTSVFHSPSHRLSLFFSQHVCLSHFSTDSSKMSRCYLSESPLKKLILTAHTEWNKGYKQKERWEVSALALQDDSLVRGLRTDKTQHWQARQRCLSSHGFDSSPAWLTANRHQGRDRASSLFPMSGLTTKTHFLMCPTCPNYVLPAGLVWTVIKKTERPSAGSYTLDLRPLCLSVENNPLNPSWLHPWTLTSPNCWPPVWLTTCRLNQMWLKWSSRGKRVLYM